MPKGYIKFEDFKTQKNAKVKIPKCPRCGKPMDSIMTNKFGKKMCGDCFAVEMDKMEAAIAKKLKKEAEENARISEEELEETFTI